MMARFSFTHRYCKGNYNGCRPILVEALDCQVSSKVICTGLIPFPIIWMESRLFFSLSPSMLGGLKSLVQYHKQQPWSGLLISDVHEYRIKKRRKDFNLDTREIKIKSL